MLRTRIKHSRIARFIMVVCCVCITALSCIVPQQAQANELLTPSVEGDFIWYQYQESPYKLGVIGRDQHSVPYYCIEQPVESDYSVGKATTLRNTKAYQIGWLLKKYEQFQSSSQQATLTQAALAFIAHDTYDPSRGTNGWDDNRKVISANTQVMNRVHELLEEAAVHAPVSIRMSMNYDDGHRTGNLAVDVLNAQGNRVPDVPLSVDITGPAQFTDASAHHEVRSASSTLTIPWVATGRGKVSARAQMSLYAIDTIESSQDLIRRTMNPVPTDTSVDFLARLSFEPSLQTVANPHIVDNNEQVHDAVSIHTNGEENYWPRNVKVHATGRFFDGISTDQLHNQVTPNSGENSQDFIKRLHELGYREHGYANAEFSEPNQTVEVSATDEQGAPYCAQRSGIGTWVWTIERSAQPKEAQQYFEHDYSSTFMETPETQVVRERVSVDSTVSEHTAIVGSEITDTIRVSGFPQDHGAFQGDEEYDLGADNPYAQVRLWWSGAGDQSSNNANADEQYRPSQFDEPQEDEHHQLIGQWDIPARNGEFKIGGGRPDAHGDAISIQAEKPGWYVFVWQFSGDDRVMPAASAYDDAWERVRVRDKEDPSPTTEAPRIVTTVSSAHVAINEPFHDTARITGAVPEGAVVIFNAHEAVEQGQTPGSSKLLLEGKPVQLDDGLRDQTVRSEETRSPKAGLVYWKATVLSKEGDIVASHELGAQGEVVTVEEDKSPTPSAKSKPAPQGLAITASNTLAVAIMFFISMVCAVALLIGVKHGFIGKKS